MKKTKQLKIFLIAAFVAVSSGAFAQVKIGSNPTTIETGSNLEVEASTGQRKVKVDKTTGQLTIKDGTEGDLRILTSDAAGGASWKDVKNTALYTFRQTAGGGVRMSIPVGGNICGSLACATYLNWEASLSVLKSVNDITVDVLGSYSLAGNTTQVQYNLYLAMDKTTPGVFEIVGQNFTSETGTNCSGNAINFKTILQNLPVRTYSLRVYAAPWANGGTAANLGIGKGSRDSPNACGAETGVDITGSNKIVILVSQ